MLRVILSILLLTGLVACSSNATEVMKSPCVGLEESPCGPKRSVNNWWLS